MNIVLDERAPIDPEIAGLIDRFDAALLKPEMTVEEFRRSYSEALSEQGAPKDPVHTQDLVIETRHGPMKARIYRADADDELPLVLYIHGGGFVLGDLDGLDVPLHVIARKSGCAILSIDYYLAPEAPYPIPFEQCQDALVWAAENRRALNVSDKIGVAGDSAGGNLTALLALWARDNNGPKIAWQGIINPVLDFPAVEQQSTLSHRLYADGPHLTAEGMKMFMEQYFVDEKHKIEASPLLAESVADLPPAFMACAQLDPLRDEGLAYAQRLADAGVDVETHCYEGMSHNFIVMSHLSRKSRLFLDQISASMAAYL